MNTLLLEHFAAVSKIAACRQAKRMQRGALTSQGGFSSYDPTLLQIPCTMQCVFIPREFRDRTQILFDSRGDSVGPRIDITTSRNIFLCSNYTSISKPAVLDKIYDAVFVVTKNSTDVYIDGEKQATLASGEAQISRINLGANDAIFYGDWLMYRHFNYVMSANEVKALHNNGDPAGYVLPVNYKGYGDVYHSDFSEGADGWHVVLSDYVTMTAADGVITISKDDANRNMVIARAHNPYDSRVIDYFVRLEFAEPLQAEVANIVARPFNSIAGVNLEISSDRLSATGTFINSGTKPNGSSLIIFQGPGAVSISVSSIQFTPAVCVAEYLPQNLVADNNGLVSSWLNSAKQLPLNDEYIPPLLETAGGYDLTAKGTPKIIYKL